MWYLSLQRIHTYFESGCNSFPLPRGILSPVLWMIVKQAPVPLHAPLPRHSNPGLRANGGGAVAQLYTTPRHGYDKGPNARTISTWLKETVSVEQQLQVRSSGS